ncbi:ABC transporter ATP-binding protein [Dactylosporangium sp. CA-092794]|uniref:ABC transporter ATP-binding protein n=1 Tax=Dactylosporangium sp. CA-092794 TaxID=3239929 RepID=UPI003D8DFB6F
MAEPGPAHGGLSARGVTVRYGGVAAVSEVDIDVRPGTIVGLIGPNGAGKTSFIDAITGFARATGEITLDGVRIDGLRPHARRRAGLARTWQSGELFNGMTVAQNVLVCVKPPVLGTVWRDLVGRRAHHDAVVDELLARVGLAHLAGAQAGSLTLGQQKLVGVARALAGAARTLLLDEPAAGLDSSESLAFAERVRAIVDAGPGALLIDHDMELVLKVCDMIYVLEFGRLIFAGSPAEVRDDPGVIAAYLGSAGGQSRG